jgi:hypothetical protein
MNSFLINGDIHKGDALYMKDDGTVGVIKPITVLNPIAPIDIFEGDVIYFDPIKMTVDKIKRDDVLVFLKNNG